jgi:hypothetical protein
MACGHHPCTYLRCQLLKATPGRTARCCTCCTARQAHAVLGNTCQRSAICRSTRTHLLVLRRRADDHEARVAEARGVHARPRPVHHSEAERAAAVDALRLHLARADLCDAQHVAVARLHHVPRGLAQRAREDARVDALLAPHVDSVCDSKAKHVACSRRAEVRVFARVAGKAVINAAHAGFELVGVGYRDAGGAHGEGGGQRDALEHRRRLDARQQVALELGCTLAGSVRRHALGAPAGTGCYDGILR